MSQSEVKIRKKKKQSKTRAFVQLFFFLLIAMISVNRILSYDGKGIPWLSSLSLHGICPFGGVVSIYTYLSSGMFLKGITEYSFILMGIMFILTIGFGPLFCGWICPLGTFQEWIGKIGLKIFGRRYNHFISYRYDKFLRFLRYGVLIAVVYITAKKGHLVFASIDPYYTLFHLWTGEVAFLGVVMLIIVTVGALFIERPWCKYLCPYGALLGIFNLFRIFKIRRNPDTCISCNQCDIHCPMNIEVSKTKVVRNHQCISCMKCTSEDKCPIQDTVKFSIGIGVKQLVKIKTFGVAIMIFVVLFGGLRIFQYSGKEVQENTTCMEEEQEHESEHKILTYESVPQDIKGSDKLSDIALYFDIPMDVFSTGFGITEEDGIMNFQCRQLEEKYYELEIQGREIGTESVRFFVSLYKGIPHTLEEEIYLPLKAVEILKQQVGLSEEQIMYFEKYQIDLSDENEFCLENIDRGVGIEDEKEDEYTIEGKTIFREVMEMGLTKQEIQEIMGVSDFVDTMKVKDLCEQKGLSFNDIKTILQEKIDKKQAEEGQTQQIYVLDNKVNNEKLVGAYENGVFTGTAKGYRPELTVAVTIQDNNITDIEIVSHNESRGYFEESFESIPKQILQTQSLKVDTITGATRTSEGIVRAVQDALKKAEK